MTSWIVVRIQGCASGAKGDGKLFATAILRCSILDREETGALILTSADHDVPAALAVDARRLDVAVTGSTKHEVPAASRRGNDHGAHNRRCL